MPTGTKVLKVNQEYDLLKGKSMAEIKQICKDNNWVYLGSYQVIAEEDYNTVMTAHQAMTYGDDLDEK